MKKRGATLAAALMVAALALPRGAGAQELGFGLEVTGGHTTLGGDAFSGDDDGPGFETVLSAMFGRGFDLGAGASISFHDRTGDRDTELVSAFLEPRFRFGVSTGRDAPHVHPFVAGRLGFSEARLKDDGDEVASNSGLLLGGVGGLEVWLSSDVALLGSVAYDFMNFEEEGGLFEGAEQEGNRLGFRGGLKVRFH